MRTEDQVLEGCIRAKAGVMVLADRHKLSDDWKEAALSVLENNALLELDILSLVKNKVVH